MNYKHYFDGESPEEYKQDIGSYATAQLLRDFAYGRILEVGSGLHKICTNSDTLDLQGSPTYEGDIQDAPIASESYDCILMSHVLEHVPNDFLALKECYRILRPGGLLVVLSPYHSTGICTTKEVRNNGHIRTYNRSRVLMLESIRFPCIYYRQVHFIYNLVWNRLKYVIKALNYPYSTLHKLFTGRKSPYYERFWWNRDALIRLFNKADERFTRNSGNALFVLQRSEQSSNP